jgi:hypothetical protein
MNRMETKTATSERFMARSVNPTSPEPRMAARTGEQPRVRCGAMMFSKHHDGVVHHQAGRHDQRHEREVVQRKPVADT